MCTQRKQVVLLDWDSILNFFCEHLCGSWRMWPVSPPILFLAPNAPFCNIAALGFQLEAIQFTPGV